jgi:hypothetical protein
MLTVARRAEWQDAIALAKGRAPLLIDLVNNTPLGLKTKAPERPGALEVKP